MYTYITCLLWSAVVLVHAVHSGNPYIEALRDRQWLSVQQYVEVRPGAFLFYWLYYADGTPMEADRKPLIIWIQGGPGIAASGVANFAEIGPLDMQMKPRNHTWVNGKNILLIDHPVGTGFSYVTNESLYATTDRLVVSDLSRLIKAFFRTHTLFASTATYIVGQSYGAKICARLAIHLLKAIKNKNLQMDLKGIGIGSGWVDPKESTLAQPDYLYNVGIIDQKGYIDINSKARMLADCIDKKDYVSASKLDSLLFKSISSELERDINLNNINQANVEVRLEKLTSAVNNYVKPTLSIVHPTLQWNYFSGKVFHSLRESFFAPSIKFLEMILNRTELTVTVYNGNLDAVTPLAGATNWVHKLKWAGADAFRNTTRLPIRGFNNGFFKIYAQLSFWWVFGSGHWVPEDNPVAMDHILDHIMNNKKKTIT